MAGLPVGVAGASAHWVWVWGSCTPCMHFLGGTSEMGGDGGVGSLSTEVPLSLSLRTTLQDLSSGVCARIPKFICVLLLFDFLFPFAAPFCLFFFPLCRPWTMKLKYSMRPEIGTLSSVEESLYSNLP